MYDKSISLVSYFHIPFSPELTAPPPPPRQVDRQGGGGGIGHVASFSFPHSAHVPHFFLLRITHTSHSVPLHTLCCTSEYHIFLSVPLHAYLTTTEHMSLCSPLCLTHSSLVLIHVLHSIPLCHSYVFFSLRHSILLCSPPCIAFLYVFFRVSHIPITFVSILTVLHLISHFYLFSFMSHLFLPHYSL
jgi:hypothetical protein